MVTKVLKWGNSLGVRIPRAFAAEAEVEVGSSVDMSVHKGRLVIRPVRRRRFVLQDLVKRISSRNLHGEVRTGAAVGREVW